MGNSSSSKSESAVASVPKTRTVVPLAERKAAIAVVTNTTLSRLSIPHDEGTDVGRLLARAQVCAARGGAALVKAELVHLVALLQVLREGKGNKVLDVATYATLGHKTVEELNCLVRLLMYNPDLCGYRAPEVVLPDPIVVDSKTDAVVHSYG